MTNIFILPPRLTGDSAFNEAPVWFKFTFLGIILVAWFIMDRKFKK